MTQAPEQILIEDRETRDEPGLSELFARLVENVRAYAGAELELIQVVCLERLKALQLSVLAAVVAVLLGLSAFIVLLIGFMMSLASAIGPLLAAVAVSLTTLVIAAAIGFAAIANLRRQFATSWSADETDQVAMGNDDDRAQ